MVMESTKIIYNKRITAELWCDSSINHFYYKFSDGVKDIDGKLDYSLKKWDDAMKVSVAKGVVSREKSKYQKIALREEITLDRFIHNEFKDNTIANLIELKYYNNYLQKYLGFKNLKLITPNEIEHTFKEQQKYGFKLSTYKITLNFIMKVFEKAVERKIIQKNPCHFIDFEYIRESEYVKFIQDKISEIYNVVSIVFHKDPLVLSFYLFLLKGKKKEKIMELRWELIDFEHNTFRLNRLKSKTYYLHPAIKDELLKVYKRSGLVYENDIEINNPTLTIEEESYKINNYIPDFSIESLEILVDELQEREPFIRPTHQNRMDEFKQLPQVSIIKPKLKIGKFAE